MKSLQVLTAVVLVFLATSIANSIVLGETTVSTYDDGDRALTTADGKSVFACDATVSIETEQGGGWLPNKTYQVNWTLRLDYVNPAYLNGSDFYIQFSWPSLENLTPTIPATALVNQTQLSLAHKTGTISAEFTPANTSDGFYMNPEFPYKVYVNGQVAAQDWASGIWYGEGGVSTNIIGNDVTTQPIMQQSEGNIESPMLTVATLVTVAALSACLAFAVVRKRKIPKCQ